MEILKEHYLLKCYSVVRVYQFLKPLVMKRREVMNIFAPFSPRRMGKHNIILEKDNNTSIVINQKSMIASGNPEVLDFRMYNIQYYLNRKRIVGIFDTHPCKTVHEIYEGADVDQAFLQQHFTLLERKPYLKFNAESYSIPQTKIKINYSLKTKKIMVLVPS